MDLVHPSLRLVLDVFPSSRLNQFPNLFSPRLRQDFFTIADSLFGGILELRRRAAHEVR